MNPGDEITARAREVMDYNPSADGSKKGSDDDNSASTPKKKNPSPTKRMMNLFLLFFQFPQCLRRTTCLPSLLGLILLLPSKKPTLCQSFSTFILQGMPLSTRLPLLKHRLLFYFISVSFFLFRRAPLPLLLTLLVLQRTPSYVTVPCLRSPGFPQRTDCPGK